MKPPLKRQRPAPERGHSCPPAHPNPVSSASSARELASTDLLILSDGTVLAHNLTPEMARVLKTLNELPD